MTDNSSLRRRKYIQLAGGAATIGAAGCLGDEGDGDDDGSGGSGGSGGDNGEQTLQIQHWWTDGAAREAIDVLFDGYRERNPDIDIEDNPVAGGAGENLQTVIRERVLAGDPPSTWQDWPGRNLADYVEAGALNDIGYIFEGDFEENFREGPLLAARAGDEDNPYVAVPTNIHRINNLFYDVPTVEEADVDPEAIDDPYEMIEVLEQVEDATGLAGISFQTGSAYSTLQLFGINLLGLFGHDTYESFRNGGSVESEVEEALEVTDEMLDLNVPDAASLSNDEAAAKIIQGDAVFAQDGDWQGANYQVTDGYDYGDDWGHVAWPGTSGIYQINTDGFPHPDSNPTPDATDAWLEWVGTAEAQQAFNQLKGGVPCRTDVDVSDYPPFLQDQFDDFSNADSNPLTIAHGDGVTPQQDVALKNAISRFMENRDVAETTGQLLDAVSQ